MSDEYLKVPEVAKLLRCKPQTIYKLMRSGKIPAIRVGKNWRIKQSSLDQWTRTQEDANGRQTIR